MPLQPETMLSREEIFNGAIIRVTKDIIRLPNGKTSAREVVHHGGGAAVVAVNDKDEVAMVRQFRYALGREMLEIPAGKIEPGEAPLTTAMRELEEEAACTAAHFAPLGQVVPTCGYCNEIIYLFYAKGLAPSRQNLDPDEFVTVEWMPLQEATALVLSGEIDDSKTAAALLKVKILRDKGEL